MTVHIPHTNSTGRKVKVIPGWDYETDCAREESSDYNTCSEHIAVFKHSSNMP